MARKVWNCPQVMEQFTDYYTDCRALPRYEAEVSDLVDRVIALDRVQSCRLAQSLLPQLYKKSRCVSPKPPGMGRARPKRAAKQVRKRRKKRR